MTDQHSVWEFPDSSCSPTVSKDDVEEDQDSIKEAYYSQLRWFFLLSLRCITCFLSRHCCCSSTSCLIGFVLGTLIMGIVLAVLLTMYLREKRESSRTKKRSGCKTSVHVVSATLTTTISSFSNNPLGQTSLNSATSPWTSSKPLKPKSNLMVFQCEK